MSQQTILELRAIDFAGPTRWRWELKDANGKFLADHNVELDESEPMYAALLDLRSYLAHHASPDQRRRDEARIIRRLGEWIGRNVMGGVAPAIVAQGTPATVRVVLPPEAHGLLCYPLELAHADGRALALLDVSLVFEVAGEDPRVTHSPVGERLRVLAVFSLPTGASVLSLRRERYRLKRCLRELAGTRGLGIDLRVLQYGATREALRDALREGDGWDVVHFSGHGLPARLVLENADGTQDHVASDEFADLLKLTRRRLKLVTLSACSSAAATIEETMRWLGIAPPPAMPTAEGDPTAADDKPLPAVARALVKQVGCAMLAMRYPVGDEFAADLTERLFDGMLRQGQSLTRAIQLALPDLTGEGEGGRSTAAGPLSVATPALFGRRAVGLTLKAPPVRGEEGELPVGLAHFPPEPQRFVGRIASMTRASAALALRSGKTGVLFHGMAGGGKTACALELAYHHEPRQRFTHFVWYKAPDPGRDIAGALTGLALAMERQLPGLKMVHVVGSPERLAEWLPRLRKYLSEESTLIVLDNLETLLKPDGGWRDASWGLLVGAMLDHDGLSRVLLTSRGRPAGLDQGRLLVESVHALSLGESLLLARELPNLSRLLRDPQGEGRRLVARALKCVQGHPKLLELTEAQAASASALRNHVERAEDAWRQGEAQTAAFFAEGSSALDAGQFLAVLGHWTRCLAGALPEGARTAFFFLCGLEEGDRQTAVVEAAWPDLWKRLELPGKPPDPGEAIAPLTAAGLVEAEEVGREVSVYRIHPGVAEAGREEAGGDFRSAVDDQMANLWKAQFVGRRKAEGGGVFTADAALRASPYLLRRRRWDEAAALLEQAIGIDEAPETIAAVLPPLRMMAAETNALKDLGVLARALGVAGQWEEAEAILSDVAGKCSEAGEFRLASAASGELIHILLFTGRAAEALKLFERRKEYTRRAGLGPWTQLGDEGQRLQILNALGRCEEVLAQVDRLRRKMDRLPEKGEQDEAVQTWSVREALLNTGYGAALRLEEWGRALSLNAEILTITKARNAPELEIARTRFNDYGPLLGLKRYEEARAVLQECRGVFEGKQDLEALNKVFSGLAALEDWQARCEQAIQFEETALRYKYQVGDPESCAISHNNLSGYMERASRAQSAFMAQRLAAGVIALQVSSGLLGRAVANLSLHFARAAPGLPEMPANFDELCEIVERVAGVRFRELFERLPGPAGSGDEAMQIVIALARKAAEE